jgi:hypothetical protein
MPQKNNKIPVTKITEFEQKYKNDWKNLIKNEQNHKDMYLFFNPYNNVERFLQKPQTQRYRILGKYCKKYEKASDSFILTNILKELKIHIDGFYEKYLKNYLQSLKDNVPAHIAQEKIINNYKENFGKNSITPKQEYEEYLSQLITLLLEIKKFLYNKDINV